ALPDNNPFPRFWTADGGARYFVDYGQANKVRSIRLLKAFALPRWPESWANSAYAAFRWIRLARRFGVRCSRRYGCGRRRALVLSDRLAVHPPLPQLLSVLPRGNPFPRSDP